MVGRLQRPSRVAMARTSVYVLRSKAGFQPNVVEGRFMIHVRHLQRPWIVIVERDADAKLLVVVTAYEVSE